MSYFCPECYLIQKTLLIIMNNSTIFSLYPKKMKISPTDAKILSEDIGFKL